MSCRVVGESDAVIPVEQLRDGQMAVIRKWGGNWKPVGRIVQQYKNDLVVLGERSGKCYPGIMTCSSSCPSCLVTVLPPGTKIEVE